MEVFLYKRNKTFLVVIEVFSTLRIILGFTSYGIRILELRLNQKLQS